MSLRVCLQFKLTSFFKYWQKFSVDATYSMIGNFVGAIITMSPTDHFLLANYFEMNIVRLSLFFSSCSSHFFFFFKFAARFSTSVPFPEHSVLLVSYLTEPHFNILQPSIPQVKTSQNQPLRPIIVLDPIQPSVHIRNCICFSKSDLL